MERAVGTSTTCAQTHDAHKMPDGSFQQKDVWPIDVTAEWARRARLMVILARDPLLRAANEAHYKNNFVDWCNDWVITYDPRKKKAAERIMPLVLFKRQRELAHFLLECMADVESGLVEKCRDMGASWIGCALSVWLWIYHPGSSIGWGSRKKEFVDKPGDLKALFPKMRKIIEYLPRWQLPAKFVMDRDATTMSIINRSNDSIINGEVGDNIGRGGRSSVYLKDESAHYEHPEMIEAALGDNTDVQIDISSVNGAGNPFYRRRQAGIIWEAGKKIESGYVRVFIMDWRDHPGKTQEWYDKRRAKYEREGMLHLFAQEVDRDYSSSIAGTIIKSEWLQACIDSHIVLGIQEIGENISAQDIADGGRDRNVYGNRKGIVLKRLEQWAGEAGDAARIAIPYAIEDGAEELDYDCIGVGAGFKTETNRMQDEPGWPQRLTIIKWDAGTEPENPDANMIPDDPESPLNKDHYGNRKAQGWFLLAARVWKTYKSVTACKLAKQTNAPFSLQYDPSELISIPSTLPLRHQLLTEMSQPVKKHMSDGRVIVDKTPDGTVSPNLADAVMMLYHPVRSPMGFMDL